MPRLARKRQKGAFYHVMCRSISEILLFNDDADKNKYLDIISTAYKELGFSVLAYCLMDTHLHLLINSVNADISKIMKKINVTYAIYYNRRYGNRKGPVFAGRFESKIITDEHYFLMTSLYIHNNPKDIPAYQDKIEQYPFSSFNAYINKSVSYKDFLDTHTILGLFSTVSCIASTDYVNLFKSYSSKKSPEEFEKLNNLISEDDINAYVAEFNKENGYESRNEKHLNTSNLSKEQILQKVCSYFDIENSEFLKLKFSKEYLDYKSILVVLLRSLIDTSRKDICKFLGNISASNVYTLAKRGSLLLESHVNSLFNRSLIYSFVKNHDV